MIKMKTMGGKSESETAWKRLKKQCFDCKF